MNMRLCLLVFITVLNNVLCKRVARDATVEVQEKKDLESEGTIVDPYLYGAPLPHGHLPYGIDGPGQIGLIGPQGPIIAPGYGGYGHVGAPYYKTGADYGNQYLRSGINEGAYGLGNKGQEILQQEVGRGYDDGSYHKGGSLKEGGYGGGEVYNDNKNHLSDSNFNKGYYNGVQGSRKDLGGGELFDKNQQHSQNGLNQYGGAALNGFNKGHQKKGFRKSYHKDESGNDESYYDSDHDEGNNQYGNKFGNYYDTNSVSSLNGGHKNNEFAAHQRGESGEEGLGKLIDRNHGVRDYYGKNNYYGNDNGYGQVGGGGSSRFGKVGGVNGYLDNYNKGRIYESYKDDGYGRGGRYVGPYY